MKNDKRIKSVGRSLSKLLRHDPDGLSMDSEGYVKVTDLLDKKEITKEELDWIISNNNKERFSYNEDETLVRANQGHNKKLNVTIKMEESDRIDTLYHGTSINVIDSIMKYGLVPRNRQHVHMSGDKETAINVGLRKGKDIKILKIDSGKMRGDGVKIWISKNGVYLTDFVDPKYISW